MNEKIYTYQLVEVKDEVLIHGQKSIECVPTNWVEFDSGFGKFCFGKFWKCFCKFMSPPYNSERKKILKDMIKKQVYSSEKWNRYPVMIRGGAGMYENIVLFL